MTDFIEIVDDGEHITSHLDRRRHGTHVTSRYGNKGKLSPEQRAQILALKGKHTQIEIAAMFDVSFQAISRIHLGRVGRNRY